MFVGQHMKYRGFSKFVKNAKINNNKKKKGNYWRLERYHRTKFQSSLYVESKGNYKNF